MMRFLSLSCLVADEWMSVTCREVKLFIHGVQQIPVVNLSGDVGTSCDQERLAVPPICYSRESMTSPDFMPSYAGVAERVMSYSS